MHIDEFLPDEQDHYYFEDNDRKVKTQFLIDHSRTAISKNNSEDVGFDYSFNPYKGCEHGCVYCYARPTHEYLGFSSGLDFETKIMVKINAPILLEETFRKKSYKPDVIIFSGNTDCYQPIEKKLEITRKALAVCLKYRNPVSLITKNSLVERDIDILKEMAEAKLIKVTLSITSLNRELQRVMEPRTSTPEMRIAVIERLAKNNIPVGVNLAPVIPGLNDEEIPEILKISASAGASFAGYITIRLPYSIKELFIEWLEREHPLKKEKILNRIMEMNKGQLYSSDWGSRFTGEGPFAENIKKIFEISCRKHNLNKRNYRMVTTSFNRNAGEDQLEMF